MNVSSWPFSFPRLRSILLPLALVFRRHCAVYHLSSIAVEFNRPLRSRAAHTRLVSFTVSRFDSAEQSAKMQQQKRQKVMTQPVVSAYGAVNCQLTRCIACPARRTKSSGCCKQCARAIALSLAVSHILCAQKSRIQIMLYENTTMRLEGVIIVCAALVPHLNLMLRVIRVSMST